MILVTYYAGLPIGHCGSTRAKKLISKINQGTNGHFIYTIKSKHDILKQNKTAKKLNNIIRDLNLNEKDENSIRTFVVVISLIAQASAIKKLVQKIVNEYHS